MSEVHLFHDPEARPQEWRAEEIDSDGDGGIDMAIFSGPHAEQRAKQFAEELLDPGRKSRRRAGFAAHANSPRAAAAVPARTGPN